MKVIVSDIAKHDMENIRDYIKNVLKNPTAAKSALVKIRKAFPLLGDNPYMGVSLEEKLDRKTDKRFFVSGSYIIIYRVREEDGIVEISRIFGGRQNYINMLFG